MRGLLSAGLGLSLGLLAGAAGAEEVLWRPTPRTALIRPAEASGVAAGQAAPQQTPLVIVGRPVALDGTSRAPLDCRVQTIAYTHDLNAALQVPVFRAKREDSPKIMPVGPSEKIGSPPTPLNLSGPDAFATGVPGSDSSPSLFGADCGPGGPAGVIPGDSSGAATEFCCPPGSACCGPVCCEPDCCTPNCGAPACCGPECPWGAVAERPYCFWLRSEYLLWSLKDSHFPALVTASPVGTPRSMAGVLGNFGTLPLVGGTSGFDNEIFSGGRFATGLWLDSCRTIGLEGVGMFLGRRNNDFIAASGGSPILARPFQDVTGAVPFENAQLVAFPGVLTGAVTVNTSAALWGAEANVRWHWLGGDTICGCPYRVDLLAGFRFVELEERLGITENLSVLPGATVPRLLSTVGPASIMVNDRFRTNNQFYGTQIGADGEVRMGRWFLNGTGKVAVGTMHQLVDVNGFTSIAVPSLGVVTTARGGLLTQPTNIGRISRNRFAVVPEIGIKVGYQLTDNLRVYAGYDFLFMSNVVRPGDQVDRSVNTSQLPTVVSPPQGERVFGLPRPMPNIKDSDFWAYGVNFGLEFRY